MRLFIYSFFLLLSLGIYAQNTADTLQLSKNLSALESKNNVSNSDIDEMLKMTAENRVDHPDFSLHHLKKIKKLIEKNKYYGAFRSYVTQIVFIYSGKSEIEKAEKIVTEIYNKHERDFDRHTKASVRFLLANIASELGEYDKSQKILDELSPDPDSVNLVAGIHYQKAANFESKGNYENALKHALKSVDIYQSINNKKYLTVALDLINIIYQKLRDYDNALIYSKKALNIALESENIDAVMTSYSNLGVIYNAKSQVDSAEIVYLKAIQMADRYDRPSIKAQNLLNLGNIKSKSGKYTEAEKIFLQSLEICKNFNISQGILLNYINLGSNDFEAKNYYKSESYYNKALEESEKLTENPYFQTHIYDGLANLFEVRGDYKNALANHKKSQEIKDEINIEASKKEIAAIQGKYDTAVKDAEIERINNEYEIKKSEIQILIVLIAFGICFAIACVSFLAFRNRQLKILYKKNVELLNSRQFVANEIQENEPEQNEPLKNIFDEIIKVMETEKIYQNPNLSINDVAQTINSNQKYVSTAITNYAQTNFNNFINIYRINEAKKLIIYQKHQTLNEIMYASGFNSRTPFYNAFVKFTGMSPKKFKDFSQNTKSEVEIEVLQET